VLRPQKQQQFIEHLASLVLPAQKVLCHLIRAWVV